MLRGFGAGGDLPDAPEARRRGLRGGRKQGVVFSPAEDPIPRVNVEHLACVNKQIIRGKRGRIQIDADPGTLRQQVQFAEQTIRVIRHRRRPGSAGDHPTIGA